MENTLHGAAVSPLYRQLMQQLRADIASGLYPVNSRIPSEAELTEKYGVSRVTVRKALSELTREGLLRRMQGKGTFVCAPRIRRSLRDVTSFHEACRHMGCVPGTKVLSAGIAPADTETREDLLLAEDADRVVEITRLRTADGQSVMLETNRFPLAYDALLREDLTGSLYAALEKLGVEAASGVHEISLCYATAQQARQLDVQPGTALLQLDQVIYDQHGTPLHTSHQVIRGDRFTFRI